MSNRYHTQKTEIAEKIEAGKAITSEELHELLRLLLWVLGYRAPLEGENDGLE